MEYSAEAIRRLLPAGHTAPVCYYDELEIGRAHV